MRFEGVSESDRLLCDLELVQALCNVRYLHYLATNKYFADDAFLAYLAHLRYWKQPEYARHLQFPQCLRFLDAVIDSAAFRAECGLPTFVDFIHQQQGAHWFLGPDTGPGADADADAGAGANAEAETMAEGPGKQSTQNMVA